MRALLVNCSATGKVLVEFSREMIAGATASLDDFFENYFLVYGYICGIRKSIASSRIKGGWVMVDYCLVVMIILPSCKVDS